MEGGFVHGHEGVREYWTRQWRLIDPHVEPITFERDETGRIVVGVHQIVRDRVGTVLVDQMVRHLYTLRDGLVSRMEIGAVHDAIHAIGQIRGELGPSPQGAHGRHAAGFD
jgi:hypothetical protein